MTQITAQNLQARIANMYNVSQSKVDDEIKNRGAENVLADLQETGVTIEAGSFDEIMQALELMEKAGSDYNKFVDNTIDNIKIKTDKSGNFSVEGLPSGNPLSMLINQKLEAAKDKAFNAADTNNDGDIRDSRGWFRKNEEKLFRQELEKVLEDIASELKTPDGKMDALINALDNVQGEMNTEMQELEHLADETKDQIENAPPKEREKILEGFDNKSGQLSEKLSEAQDAINQQIDGLVLDADGKDGVSEKEMADYQKAMNKLRNMEMALAQMQIQIQNHQNEMLRLVSQLR